MMPLLRELLVDPIERKAMTLETPASSEGELLEGAFVAQDGQRYAIERGIPRLVVVEDDAQVQTSDAFAFKWGRRHTYESEPVTASTAAWLVRKYGFESLEECARYFDGRGYVLDLGCGSGFSSLPWLGTSWWSGQAAWIGVDISLAIDVARERLGHIANTHFVQANALQLPFPDGTFDTVFAEGALHHTSSTRQALHSAARVMEPGAECHFYVYRQKGPVREFTDDYVRSELASMSEEEAWNAMRSLTTLGKVLAELKSTITLDEGVPLLGIPAGEHDVQRLVHWHFAKTFWNAEWSFEENVHVNFDWYRPRYAHRQTPADVKRWCAEADLDVHWFHEEESGLTVRAVKR